MSSDTDYTDKLRPHKRSEFLEEWAVKESIGWLIFTAVPFISCRQE